MRKCNRFLRCMAQIGASGGMLYGGTCNIDNFWVDGGVTLRDSVIAELVAALIGIPLALLGL